MNKLIGIYNLKDDIDRIKIIQNATLDKDSHSGYKIENGLLYGTKEWFYAIDTGMIQKHILNGVISKVYMTGHNDFPEFEIKSKEGFTTWMRQGVEEAYQVGKNIELIYVEQKYKRPSEINGTVAKCVIQIYISDGA